MLNFPKDVAALRVFVDNREVVPEKESGYLGDFEMGAKFRLEIAVPHYAKLAGLEVAKDGDIRVREPFPIDETRVHPVYVKNIGIMKDKWDIPCTMFPQNSIHFVELVDENLLTFRVWMIGIRGEDQHFFLVGQEVNEGRLYRKGDEIVSPQLLDRPKLMRFVASEFGKRLSVGEDLRNKLTELPRFDITKEKPKSGEGKVLFYTVLQGFGCISTEKGDARVHWTRVCMPGSEGMRVVELKRGARVSFEELKSVNDSHTSFKWEVEGVRLL